MPLFYGEIPSKSLEAAEAMKLSAQDLLKLGIIDEIIEEPLGELIEIMMKLLIILKIL